MLAPGSAARKTRRWNPSGSCEMRVPIQSILDGEDFRNVSHKLSIAGCEGLIPGRALSAPADWTPLLGGEGESERFWGRFDDDDVGRQIDRQRPENLGGKRDLLREMSAKGSNRTVGWDWNLIESLLKPARPPESSTVPISLVDAGRITSAIGC